MGPGGGRQQDMGEKGFKYLRIEAFRTKDLEVL